jgi:hypothetical protein
MVRRLTWSDRGIAILLLAALVWAVVQLGPIAIERWF